jgi:hypothetical protein
MPPPSGDPMDVSGWQRPFKRLKVNPQVDGAASASMMAQPGAHSSKLTVSYLHSFSQSNSAPCVWMISAVA